ncbi:MAG: radical SAM protein [Proteobacteria bacterium]|nr:radical SAM protein [Pseudomonadota bacterium]
MNQDPNPEILLVTPPLTQINTPYPATAYLKGFLVEKGFKVTQVDLGLELILALFSAGGLERLFEEIETKGIQPGSNGGRILGLKNEYLKTVDPVVRFLQNRDSTLAYRICTGEYLPRGTRFEESDDLDWAFGNLGFQDKARFLATLYLEDIGDLIKETVSPDFGFSRYAERLGLSATSFLPIEEALNQSDGFIDGILLEILDGHLRTIDPDIVGITVPFPGCLYGALKCGGHLKAKLPHAKIVLGGGYVNTELRELDAPEIFRYVDFVVADDGERPFLQLIEYLNGRTGFDSLRRTFSMSEDRVVLADGCTQPDFPSSETGTPDYSNLKLDDYLSIIEIANPMHRLWNDGRWNKVTVAHGCYWKKCTFCDTTLDYIRRFDPVPADVLADRIETIARQTRQTGFHFVDEAAPQKSLKELAVEILRRDISISWWANVRFENGFSDDLCRLLAASGCIAVSGGLETASDRLLKRMRKGVTLAQAAKVANGFQEAGIMVHAYLMYGFPTETAQETIDSLEAVRQFFANGLVQSGFWHRFSLTAHSPMGLNPENFGMSIRGPEKGSFAYNDLQYDDPHGCDHDLFNAGLKKAIYNYMHGIGLDYELDFWFDFDVPQSTVAPDFVEHTLYRRRRSSAGTDAKQVLWIGSRPELANYQSKKKGKKVTMSKLLFHEKSGDFEIRSDKELGEWLVSMVSRASINEEKPFTLQDLIDSYREHFNAGFESLRNESAWNTLRKIGLLLI